LWKSLWRKNIVIDRFTQSEHSEEGSKRYEEQSVGKGVANQERRSGFGTRNRNEAGEREGIGRICKADQLAAHSIEHFDPEGVNILKGSGGREEQLVERSTEEETG